ncbi:hypothetical protein CLTHE_30130 [Clostridium thermobutyricum DSM 4928]|uniref:Uncharacterized protein n=1 Tax=Clostridium thermobutyricum DSM 4928 TaxID=1121339 RepID=A0A1V4SNX7_9CLOT|nr:hypothetical protein CLTHE_30130 [Clostridium thermobutyricum DSM 4928]
MISSSVKPLSLVSFLVSVFLISFVSLDIFSVMQFLFCDFINSIDFMIAISIIKFLDIAFLRLLKASWNISNRPIISFVSISSENLVRPKISFFDISIRLVLAPLFIISKALSASIKLVQNLVSSVPSSKALKNVSIELAESRLFKLPNNLNILAFEDIPNIDITSFKDVILLLINCSNILTASLIAPFDTLAIISTILSKVSGIYPSDLDISISCFLISLTLIFLNLYF